MQEDLGASLALLGSGARQGVEPASAVSPASPLRPLAQKIRKPFWECVTQLYERGPFFNVAYFEREEDARPWAEAHGFTAHLVPGAGTLWRCQREAA